MERKWDIRFAGRGCRVLFCMLVFAAACLTWGCQCESRTDKAKTAAPVITGVQVTTVQAAATDSTMEVTGTVKSDHTTAVASRIMGRVTTLNAREGDQVRAGQIIMKIEDHDLVQKVAGANMALATARQNRDLAETTLKRYRKLYEEKALSQQEMDEMESRGRVAASEYERAKAAVEEVRTMLGYATIKAPIAGTVTNRTIAEGGMAIPGQPLLTIESPASLYAECFVDESMLGQLKKGMPVSVMTESQNDQVRGTVRDIVPAVDARSRTFVVKVGLPAGKSARAWKSGNFVRVLFSVGKKDVLLVPSAAIVHKGQLTGLYTVAQGGTVTYRLIKTGRSYPGDQVEILSGLVANEQIIASGIKNAVDGGVIQGSR